MLRIPLPRRSPVTTRDALLGEIRARVAGSDQLATIGKAGDSSGPQAKLFQYWTRGAGGAKIAWGTDGSFARCKKMLGPHLPANYNLAGMCANLHKRATGEWPTEGGKAGVPS